jgi:hypothetical protein
MSGTPFQRFVRGLEAAQLDMNEMLTELRAFAEIMAKKSNTLEMDENGFFYTTASGTLEEIIPTIHKQLERLERIKKQKDAPV